MYKLAKAEFLSANQKLSSVQWAIWSKQFLVRTIWLCLFWIRNNRKLCQFSTESIPAFVHSCCCLCEQNVGCFIFYPHPPSPPHTQTQGWQILRMGANIFFFKDATNFSAIGFFFSEVLPIKIHVRPIYMATDKKWNDPILLFISKLEWSWKNTITIKE